MALSFLSLSIGTPFLSHQSDPFHARDRSENRFPTPLSVLGPDDEVFRRLIRVERHPAEVWISFLPLLAVRRPPGYELAGLFQRHQKGGEGR